MESLLPETLASTLPLVYDLAEPVTCDWLSSGLNDVFAVNADTAQYILKVYRAGWRTSVEVRDEVNALLHLDRKGYLFPFPSPAETAG